MAREKKPKGPDRKPKSDVAKAQVSAEPANAVPGGENAPSSDSQNGVASENLGRSRIRSGLQGVWTMFLGGSLIAAIAFLAAQYSGENRWPFASGPSLADEIADVVESQLTQVSTLEGQLSELTLALSELAPTDVTDDLDARIGNMVQVVREQADRLDMFGQRLGDLENRPVPEVGASADAVKAYERELAAIRLMFETELTRIEAAQENVERIETNASERAAASTIRAAFSQVKSDLDRGMPFESSLAALTEAGVDVPSHLTELSRVGVVSLAELQSQFPNAARNALSAARADVATGGNGRFVGFLRAQLGARSLEPKQGSDTDSILSRAEAALRLGDLGQSLDELSNLPDSGVAQMAGWVDSARARQRAVADVAALAEIVN